MDPLAAVTAIANAVEAIFTYMTEHERGMTSEQRAAQNQWPIDAQQFMKRLGDKVLKLLED
jgi:hypothetical protein